MRWTENGQFRRNDKTIIYYGGHEHQRGVALILDKRLCKSILGCWFKSDRLLLVKLKSIPLNINMIVAYAPTTDADEQKIEEFYDSLDELYSNCKSQEINILIGDFNAKVGSEKHGKTVGPHGLGMRNGRGERLID